MMVTLSDGDYWDFRWTYEEESCAQGSGCNSDSDSGMFRVTLGAPQQVGGRTLYAVTVTGRDYAWEEPQSLAPAWQFIGTDGAQLLGSVDGVSVTTLFDASSGGWTGGGFFGRFDTASEAHSAAASAITTADAFAAWDGVRPGPAIAVARSDSESMCELIEGRQICPRDESFSTSERQLYRDGVGPFGYTYQRSVSFSGGGFFSSNRFEEAVALVASSLQGDERAFEFETEPNDDYEQAEGPGSLPFAIFGTVHRDLDPLFPLNLTGDLAFPGHDFYVIETGGVRSASIELTAISNTESTLGLIVTAFDGETLGVAAISLEQTATQAVSFDVEQGILYTVVVGALESPSGRTEYLLTVR
jgi:hypothetical protein